MKTEVSITAKSHFLDKTILCLFIIAMFMVIWRRHEATSIIAIAVVLIAMSIHLLQDVRRTLGIDIIKKPIVQDWLVAITITLFLAATLASFSWLIGALQGKDIFNLVHKSGSEMLVEKLPTVIFQQILLQWFLTPILVRIWSGKWTVAVLGASVFSLFHLPNPILMILTFIAGVAWVAYYQERRRLTPLIASHFVLAILASGLCGEYVFHMRVGPSCVKLLPKSLAYFHMQGLEIPGTIYGSIDTVAEKGSLATIQGWVFDAYHDLPPQALFLETGRRLVPLQEVSFDRLDSDSTNGQLKNRSDKKYRFRAVVDRSDLPKSGEASFWAKNANGWFGSFSDHQSFPVYLPPMIKEMQYQESFQAVRQASAIEGSDNKVEFQ